MRLRTCLTWNHNLGLFYAKVFVFHWISHFVFFFLSLSCIIIMISYSLSKSSLSQIMILFSIVSKVFCVLFSLLSHWLLKFVLKHVMIFFYYPFIQLVIFYQSIYNLIFHTSLNMYFNCLKFIKLLKINYLISCMLYKCKKVIICVS